MIYAPVTITTLNRYEHFKRCIESLEKNPWAKCTEIYISVDFPPSEKYKKGYRAITDYINGREYSGFKDVHLYFQKENLGPYANHDFLREEVFKKFDRIITLEDDMEVAPNFLEFMDKALEVSSKDKKIYGAAGFVYGIKFPKAMKGTAFKASTMAWGFGVCRDKYMKMKEKVSEEWLNNIVHDGKKMLEIFYKDQQVFYYLLNGYILNHKAVFFDKDGKLASIDIVRAVYLIVNDMYTILPTVSKCRNWGMDGTGQNCGSTETMAVHKQEIDMEQRFAFRIEDDRKINRIIERRQSRRFSAATGISSWQVWKALLYYYYLLFMNKMEPIV